MFYNSLVRERNTTPIIAVATANDQLRLQHNSDTDSIVRPLILAATEYFEFYTGCTLLRQQATAKYTIARPCIIPLPLCPFIAIVSVKYLPAVSREFVTITNYGTKQNLNTGTVAIEELPSDLSCDYGSNLEVIYTVGRAEETTDVNPIAIQAIKMLIGDFYYGNTLQPATIALLKLNALPKI